MSVEVEVEPADLKTDSQAWHDVSSEFSQLASSVSTRDLPDSAFMMAGYSFAQIYRGYLTTVSGLLRDGATESREVASLLNAASTDYEEANDLIVAQAQTLAAELEES